MSRWPSDLRLAAGSNEDFIKRKNGPRHAKTCLRAYADSEVPDQPAHNRIISYCRCMNGECMLGWYLRMQRMIRICAYCILSEVFFFAWRGPNITYILFLYTMCNICYITYAFKGNNSFTLRKHAYSNILKILPPKNENFQVKKIWYFFIVLLKT